MSIFETCSRVHCRQQACLASGEEQLCGVHWRVEETARQVADVRSIRLQRIEDAETIEDLKPLLRELVEAMVDNP